MNAPDYQRFFEDYASAFERSLGDHVDVDAIRGAFAEKFIHAGPPATIEVGANDQAFATGLQHGYQQYKAIGTCGMKVSGVEVEALDALHDRVRVHFVAHYRKRLADGSALQIPFSGVYLLQKRDAGPRIFGYLAGDEMALYRQHGLIDADGNPQPD